MPDIWWKLIDNPLPTAVGVIALLVYLLVKHEQKRLLGKSGNGQHEEVTEVLARLGKAWVDRAEKHFATVHKIAIDADEAVRATRQLREDLVAAVKTLSEQGRKLDRVELGLEGVTEREKEHYKQQQEARQEFVKRLEDLGRDLDRDITAIREMVGRL